MNAFQPTAITHEKKGKWSEPNLQGIMFHVNLQGCILSQKTAPIGLDRFEVFHDRDPIAVSFTTLTEDAIWVFIVAFGVGREKGSRRGIKGVFCLTIGLP